MGNKKKKVIFCIALIVLGIFIGFCSFNFSNFGDLGTWFSGLVTSLGLIFTYRQSIETKIQSNKNLEEMRKQREEAYKPNLFISYSKKTIKLFTNCSKFEINVKLTNLGNNSAQNIDIQLYTNLKELNKKYNENLKELNDESGTIQYKISPNIKDSTLINQIGYIFSNKSETIKLSFDVYLNMIKDYILKLDNRKENIDDKEFLPIKALIKYQSLEGITYQKEIIFNFKLISIDRKFNKKVKDIVLEISPLNQRSKTSISF